MAGVRKMLLPVGDGTYRCGRCGWIGEPYLHGTRLRCPPCKAASAAIWRSKNMDRIVSYQRRYALDRIQHPRPYVRQEYRRLRKLWLRAGGVTAKELRAIAERDGHRCVYCGTAPKTFCFKGGNLVGFDHVVPRIAGGKHAASNLVVCCAPCNIAKGKKDASEFLDFRSRRDADLMGENRT